MNLNIQRELKIVMGDLATYKLMYSKSKKLNRYHTIFCFTGEYSLNFDTIGD